VAAVSKGASVIESVSVAATAALNSAVCVGALVGSAAGRLNNTLPRKNKTAKHAIAIKPAPNTQTNLDEPEDLRGTECTAEVFGDEGWGGDNVTLTGAGVSGERAAASDSALGWSTDWDSFFT
jgi:hypothetical protein